MGRKSSAPAKKAQPERPAYMQIFHNLLKRHHEFQPKFKRSASKAVPKESPSMSFSNTSTRSCDPSAGSSTKTNTNPGVALKEPTQTLASMSLKSYDTKPTINAGSIRSGKGTNVGSFTNIDTIDAPSASHRTTTRGAILDRRRPTTPAERSLRRAVDKAKREGAIPAYKQSPAGTVISLPSGKSLVSTKFPQTTTGSSSKVALKRDSSAPSVSHAPEAVLGTSTPSPGGHRRTQAHNDQASLAKTIAEQTPNAFQTLGPGFNKNAAAEKSLTLQSAFGSSLGSGLMPSDYEHIFHAPSEMPDSTDEQSSVEKLVREKKTKSKVGKKV